jgi:hypothetical protein
MFLNSNTSVSMYLFCNSRIHVITLYSGHVCVYYASMLWCWHLVWILVRTDYPCLGVGCHNYHPQKTPECPPNLQCSSSNPRCHQLQRYPSHDCLSNLLQRSSVLLPTAIIHCCKKEISLKIIAQGEEIKRLLKTKSFLFS